MSDFGDCTVVLLGRVGQDPEVRQTHNGKSVTTISVAVDDRGDTHWHRVVCWNQTADFVGSYVGKGDIVHVVGNLVYRSWESDGQKRTSAEIIARRLQKVAGQRRNPSSQPRDHVEPTPDDGGFDEIPF